MLAGYRGNAHDGVRSVATRLGSEFARAVAAELLKWAPPEAEPALLAQAREDAAWFREDAKTYVPQGRPFEPPAAAAPRVPRRRAAAPRPKKPPKP